MMSDQHGLLDRMTDAAAMAAAAAAGFPSTTDGLLDPTNRGAQMLFAASELPHHLMRLDAHTIPTSVTYFTESQSFCPLQSYREKSMLEEACEQQHTEYPQLLQSGNLVTGKDYPLQPTATGLVTTRLALGSTDNNSAPANYHYYLQTHQPLVSAHSTNMVPPTQSAVHISVEETHDTHESPTGTTLAMFDLHCGEVDRSLSAAVGMQRAMLSSGLVELDTSPSGEKIESTEAPESVSLGAGSLCLICGDRATGKHYGAYSCDGCKGFFRRSVRRNHSYTCRQKRQCVVTKDKRNQCRFCRLRKCFRVGMKKSAVQNERDKISNRPLAFDTIISGQSLLDLKQLLNAELKAQSVIQKKQNVDLLTQHNHEFTNSTLEELHSDPNDNKLRFADATDICESIKTQLIFLIEWAKNLPSFGNLTMNDQVALLQSHAGEMLILGAVWRSLSTTVQTHGDLSIGNSKGTTTSPGSYSSDQTVISKLQRKNSSVIMSQHAQAQRPLGWPLSESEIRPQSISSHTSDSSQTTPPRPPPPPSSSSSVPGQQSSAIPPTGTVLNAVGLESELRPVGSLANEPVFDYHQQLILLGNNRFISRHSPQPDIAEIANRILDQLYQPMFELCLEDAEIACLRAIIFFDPNCANLSDQGRQVVRACQYQIQTELMHLMNDKLYLPQGRFGALLLLLPDLRSITYRMIDRLQIAKQLGLTRLDGLLTEILLSGSDILERNVSQPEESGLQCSSVHMSAERLKEDGELHKPRNDLSPYPNNPNSIIPTTPSSIIPKERVVCEYPTTSTNTLISPTSFTNLSTSPGLMRMADVDPGRSGGPHHLSPMPNSVNTQTLTQQGTQRTGLMSSSTAFVPYSQGHSTVVQQSTTENDMASSSTSTSRTGWGEFGFGRGPMSGSMFDCCYHQLPPPDMVSYPTRRFNPTEHESHPSFLVNIPQDTFANSVIASSSFDVSSTPISVDASGYDSEHYYRTGQVNLPVPSISSNDTTGRLGLALIPTCSSLVPSSSSVSRTEIVPRLMGMFAMDPQSEDNLYSFYHTNP